mgnify:FL=1
MLFRSHFGDVQGECESGSVQAVLILQSDTQVFGCENADGDSYTEDDLIIEALIGAYNDVSLSLRIDSSWHSLRLPSPGL